jgi:hypothetical protein
MHLLEHFFSLYCEQLNGAGLAGFKNMAVRGTSHFIERIDAMLDGPL